MTLILLFPSMNTEVGVERETQNQGPETHLQGTALIRRSVGITEMERHRVIKLDGLI